MKPFNTDEGCLINVVPNAWKPGEMLLCVMADGHQTGQEITENEIHTNRFFDLPRVVTIALTERDIKMLRKMLKKKGLKWLKAYEEEERQHLIEEGKI